MRLQKTLQKIKDKAYKKGYEDAMNKLIEDHISDSKKFFYPTGVLAETIGRLTGHVSSMRNDNLSSLDKKYYADHIDKLIDDLQDLRKFMFDHGMYMVRLEADKN